MVVGSSPLVSVIVPTYNRAYILRQAIDCILAQSYSNWELLIIDDGSTDDTKIVVQEYTDPRIRYFRKRNGGPCSARNYGLKRAMGKWITYLDSDDVLFEQCLRVMVSRVEADSNVVFALPRGIRKLDLYEGGTLISTVDDSEDMPDEFTVKDIFMRHARFACLGMIHLRRLSSEGICWDEHIKGMEDWEFLMSIGECYPNGFLYVDDVLYEYHQRFGTDGLCSQSDYATWADAFEYAYRKHQNDHMLAGQTWYPSKVNKWRKRQVEFEAGKRPPYQKHYFI